MQVGVQNLLSLKRIQQEGHSHNHQRLGSFDPIRKKEKKNRGESKCETTCDLYINHIICHTSIISKRCANAQIYINIIPLQCFRNMNLLSIYWQEHNVCSVQRLSELGERTTTTRFGLKRRPVDHLDGHDMTHF